MGHIFLRTQTSNSASTRSFFEWTKYIKVDQSELQGECSIFFNRFVSILVRLELPYGDERCLEEESSLSQTSHIVFGDKTNFSRSNLARVFCIYILKFNQKPMYKKTRRSKKKRIAMTLPSEDRPGSTICLHSFAGFVSARSGQW